MAVDRRREWVARVDRHLNKASYQSYVGAASRYIEGKSTVVSPTTSFTHGFQKEVRHA